MSSKPPKAMEPTPRVPVVESPESVRKWRRLVRVRNSLIIIWLSGLGTELLLFPLMGVLPALKEAFIPVMGALTVCWFGACLAAVLFQTRIEKHIRQTFQNKDITGLGCWIDTLFAPASTRGLPQTAAKCHAEARAGMLEQLSLLTEATAYLLHTNERRTLYKTLYGQDAELISVVLGVIPVLGDMRALPFVRPLAEGKGLAVMNTELQAEAQACLIQLQANLDLRSGSQGLLRASQPPQAPNAELLIPAHANNETDPKELLRADVQK